MCVWGQSLSCFKDHQWSGISPLAEAQRLWSKIFWHLIELIFTRASGPLAEIINDLPPHLTKGTMCFGFFQRNDGGQVSYDHVTQFHLYFQWHFTKFRCYILCFRSEKELLLWNASKCNWSWRCQWILKSAFLTVHGGRLPKCPCQFSNVQCFVNFIITLFNLIVVSSDDQISVLLGAFEITAFWLYSCCWMKEILHVHICRPQGI